MTINRYYLLRAFVIVSVFLGRLAAAEESGPTKFIKLDEHGHYAGLSDYSKKLIEQSRDVLRQRKHIFNEKFREFESIFHAAHVNRLAQGNMFLYGPPGGAKSKFVKWLFSHEQEPGFELQMHQMMTEQAFVGGQNFDAAREGRFDINTEGSLANFRVALIDEMDKGNPAALAALLSLLNERQILAGNKVIQSRLETIFSTSNANVYEIYQQFSENGMRSTAAALLNRFTSIAFVPNWLPKLDQAALDKNYLQELDAFFNGHSNGFNHLDKNLNLDWQGLRLLARYLLRPSDEFFSVSREFIDALRSATINALDQEKIYDSEDSLPYYPTAEYTERLREKVHDVILMSILLDLIASKLTDNITDLENALKMLPYHRLEVGPLSLWRAYLSLTTITFGKARLNFTAPGAGTGAIGVDLDFGNFFGTKEKAAINGYKAKDKREEQGIRYLTQEQERFRNSFLTILSKHKEVLEDSAAFSGMFSCLTDCVKTQNLQDAERLLFALAA